MENLMDIDIQGLEDTPGIAREYYDEEAIKNALLLWLTSKKGEFLYNPNDGGILEVLIFKTITESLINKLRFKILNGITIKFAPQVRVEKLNIIPDYERRILKVDLEYTGVVTEQTERLVFFTRANYENVNYTYQDIEYIEENLYNFCVVKKPSQTGKKLLYDSREESWIWGEFKFINLTPVDLYFTQILELCNQA